MKIELAQDLVVSTLANCATFQALVGAANSAAATVKVYQDALPKPATESYAKADLIALRPYAVVGFEADIASWSTTRIATGGSTDGCWQTSGILRIEIIKNADLNIAPAADMRAFREQAGSIIDEMANQYETGGVTADRYDLQGPYRIADEHLEELGDHLWVIITVYLGRNSG